MPDLEKAVGFSECDARSDLGKRATKMKLTTEAKLAAEAATWTDSYLRSQYAAGPGGFQEPRFWDVVRTEFERRGLPPEEPAASEEPTPWFLVSRLAGTTWPSSLDLPMTYLKFGVFFGVLYAIVNAADFAKAISDYFGYHLYPDDARFPIVELVNTAWPALFALAFASRRPWAWYSVMFALAVGTIGFFAEDVSKGFAALIWSALMWLYLARRRRQFGLRPWPFVM